MKKRGFTLIEMVIVITVLGLLMAFLIPKITEAQAKARDIRRQSDITMISTALVSYKHDHGEFPPSPTTGICVSDLWEGYLSGYLTNIPQDPSGKGIEEHWQFNKGTKTYTGFICSSGYGYIGSGLSFLLIYPVDDNKNGNYKSFNNAYHYYDFIKKGAQLRQLLSSTTTGDYYIYIYN